MLRPMVATTAVTAALILLAGCGGDDTKSESGSDTNNGSQSTTSATPSTPTAPSFDPPKAFTASAAYPVPDYEERDMYDDPQYGMVGQVAVVANYRGISGRDVVDPDKAWEIKSTEADTTTVSEVTKPMAVKVDGKDLAVVAYAQSDKGNGTQKPQGLVLVQWIDVATGQKFAEVSTPVSKVDGTGSTAAGTPNLQDVQYDPETGQVAIGVTANGLLTATSRYATVYADPTTKKSTVVPGVLPGAVHGGVVAGAKEETQQNSDDAAVLIVDGASGKVTKQVPLKQSSLRPLAGGAKHAFFYGTLYSKDSMEEVSSLFAVDLSTGALVKSAPGLSARDSGGYECTWDQATTVVCTERMPTGPKEIFGFDDSTGKKAWGWTSKSGGRIVPRVTAAYHGVVYVQTEKQAVLLDGKTGEDLPSGSPSEGGASSSPSAGDTPSSSDSPSAGDTPSDSKSAGGSDLSLWDGKQWSPSAVSPYGGVYGQTPQSSYGSGGDIQLVTIYLKPTA